MHRTIRAASACAVALVAACSQDPSSPTSDAISPALSAAINTDLATVATDVVSQDVEVMRGPGGIFGFGLRADREKFECTNAGREGLTVTRTCVYKDAAGNTQSAYDSLTTASVSVNATVKGELTRGPVAMTIDRVSDFTVSGLAGKETTATWNGGGRGTLKRVRVREDSTTRTYDMSFTIRRTNVVIPVPRTENSWPLSGTVTKSFNITVTVDDSVKREVTREVVITFNGTSKPIATVNGEPYELDLSTRGRAKRRGNG